LHETLKQLAKFVIRQAGVSYNSAHRYGIDRIVPRNRQFSVTIGQNDMSTLAQYRETNLLQSPNCILVIYAWQLRHD
jgi:hypothetical protein